MLIEKEIRYDKRIDCNPVYQLPTEARVLLPQNLTHYGDLYLSARGTGITYTEYDVRF